MINENDLHTLSQEHIEECYAFYRKHAPFHPGYLIRVTDDKGRIYGIGKCVAVYWSDKKWDWIVCVELMEKNGPKVSEFISHRCARHVGFYPDVVK